MYNLIIYDSRYGNTKKVVDIFQRIIGYSKAIRPEEFKLKYKENYDNFIFVSPVYIERLLPSVEKFIDENKEWLKEKKVYGCAINMVGERGLDYLNKMQKDLDGALVMKTSLYGEIRVKSLTKADYKGLKFFCENIGEKLGLQIPFGDLNLYDEKCVIEIALEIKKQIEIRRKSLDKKLVEKIVYDFIKEKNTCVLATGYGDKQRGTPLEYILYKEALYFISEGGVKFANLYRNKNASVGIYNDFEGFNKLCGLQIEGELEEVKLRSEEYFKIMELRKISKKALDNLEVNLYMIKFNIKRIEAIHSKFKKYGGLPRQILEKKV
ncbi:flavodoxin domain-containing protein [uncultured Clostridium sp.]|uniref:flavodoxin domain-containing protein n=1 Tax=uncultured Clostridium sp. TaxID=59620 RepID=UPI0026216263|nr:flavodoxin domain-containing protein [uncultured Clostridium sp.]